MEETDYLDIIEGMLYLVGDDGVDLKQIAGVLEISKKEAANLMKDQKMVEQSSASLSNAALETLAIIAYNQPITRVGIEDIRGVGCDAMIRKLIAKALIKEVGREDSPGMPILYGVTDEFMDTFGLTSLDELPNLADIVEIDEQKDIFETRYHENIEDDNESH